MWYNLFYDYYSDATDKNEYMSNCFGVEFLEGDLSSVVEQCKKIDVRNLQKYYLNFLNGPDNNVLKRKPLDHVICTICWKYTRQPRAHSLAHSINSVAAEEAEMFEEISQITNYRKTMDYQKFYIRRFQQKDEWRQLLRKLPAATKVEIINEMEMIGFVFIPFNKPQFDFSKFEKWNIQREESSALGIAILKTPVPKTITTELKSFSILNKDEEVTSVVDLQEHLSGWRKEPRVAQRNIRKFPDKGSGICYICFDFCQNLGTHRMTHFKSKAGNSKDLEASVKKEIEKKYEKSRNSMKEKFFAYRFQTKKVWQKLMEPLVMSEKSKIIGILEKAGVVFLPLATPYTDVTQPFGSWNIARQSDEFCKQAIKRKSERPLISCRPSVNATYKTYIDIEEIDFTDMKNYFIDIRLGYNFTIEEEQRDGNMCLLCWTPQWGCKKHLMRHLKEEYTGLRKQLTVHFNEFREKKFAVENEKFFYERFQMKSKWRKLLRGFPLEQAILIIEELEKIGFVFLPLTAAHSNWDKNFPSWNFAEDDGKDREIQDKTNFGVNGWTLGPKENIYKCLETRGDNELCFICWKFTDLEKHNKKHIGSSKDVPKKIIKHLANKYADNKKNCFKIFEGHRFQPKANWRNLLSQTDMEKKSQIIKILERCGIVFLPLTQPYTNWTESYESWNIENDSANILAEIQHAPKQLKVPLESKESALSVVILRSPTSCAQKTIDFPLAFAMDQQTRKRTRQSKEKEDAKRAKLEESVLMKVNMLHQQTENGVVTQQAGTSSNHSVTESIVKEEVVEPQDVMETQPLPEQSISTKELTATDREIKAEPCLESFPGPSSNPVNNLPAEKSKKRKDEEITVVSVKKSRKRGCSTLSSTSNAENTKVKEETEEKYEIEPKTTETVPMSQNYAVKPEEDTNNMPSTSVAIGSLTTAPPIKLAPIFRNTANPVHEPTPKRPKHHRRNGKITNFLKESKKEIKKCENESTVVALDESDIMILDENDQTQKKEEDTTDMWLNLDLNLNRGGSHLVQIDKNQSIINLDSSEEILILGDTPVKEEVKKEQCNDTASMVAQPDLAHKPSTSQDLKYEHSEVKNENSETSWAEKASALFLKNVPIIRDSLNVYTTRPFIFLPIPADLILAVSRRENDGITVLAQYACNYWPQIEAINERVKSTESARKGYCAAEDIEPNTFIAGYYGMQQNKLFKRKDTSGGLIGHEYQLNFAEPKLVTQGHASVSMMVKTCKNDNQLRSFPGVYINHSKLHNNATLEIVKGNHTRLGPHNYAVLIKTTRKLMKGEEIFVDFSNILETIENQNVCPCDQCLGRCHCTNCSGKLIHGTTVEETTERLAKNYMNKESTSVEFNKEDVSRCEAFQMIVKAQLGLLKGRTDQKPAETQVLQSVSADLSLKDNRRSYMASSWDIKELPRILFFEQILKAVDGNISIENCLQFLRPWLIQCLVIVEYSSGNLKKHLICEEATPSTKFCAIKVSKNDGKFQIELLKESHSNDY